MVNHLAVNNFVQLFPIRWTSCPSDQLVTQWGSDEGD